MIDAAKAHADDEDDRQRELLREIGSIDMLAERNAKTTDAFDEDRVGLLFQLPETTDDVRQINGATRFLCSDMRGNGPLISAAQHLCFL